MTKTEAACMTKTEQVARALLNHFGERTKDSVCAQEEWDDLSDNSKWHMCQMADSAIWAADRHDAERIARVVAESLSTGQVAVTDAQEE